MLIEVFPRINNLNNKIINLCKNSNQIRIFMRGKFSGKIKLINKISKKKCKKFLMIKISNLILPLKFQKIQKSTVNFIAVGLVIKIKIVKKIKIIKIKL